VPIDILSASFDLIGNSFDLRLCVSDDPAKALLCLSGNIFSRASDTIFVHWLLHCDDVLGAFDFSTSRLPIGSCDRAIRRSGQWNKERTILMRVVQLSGGLKVKGPLHALKRVDKSYCLGINDEFCLC
jgi:hypothetical protein